jgi:hyperosmotically inducible protein
MRIGKNIPKSDMEVLMIQTLKTLTVALAFLFLMTGCQVMTGQTLGENVDDTSITTSVKSKLGSDRLVTLTRVGVETTNKIVYLTGEVQTSEQKLRAGSLAAQVGGVRQVVNNLQIQRN